MELTVYVAADRHWGTHLLHVWLIDQNFFSLDNSKKKQSKYDEWNDSVWRNISNCFSFNSQSLWYYWFLSRFSDRRTYEDIRWILAVNGPERRLTLSQRTLIWLSGRGLQERSISIDASRLAISSKFIALAIGVSFFKVFNVKII